MPAEAEVREDRCADDQVKGYFRERTYEKDDETKTVRSFVLEDLAIERKKIRQRAD